MRLPAAAVLCLIFWAAVPSFAAEPASFTFGKVDLSLLEQVDMMDKRFDRDGMVLHDDKLNEYVSRIGRAMLPTGAAPERVKWEFRVLRDPMPNAFAMPNGSIYVNTGLISLLESEDQLASVLAHEITHAADRHSYLAFRDYRKKATIANISSFVANNVPGGSMWGAAVRLGASMVPVIMTAMVNGYSRELERNADMYSFGKMVEGNYDPREMPATFRLLQRKDEVDLEKTFYSDHPKLEDRVTYMTALVTSKAPKPVDPEIAAERKLRYQQLTENAVREDITLAILSERPRTALARAQKLVAFNAESAENQYALAEAYRALGPWTGKPTSEELSKDGKKDAAKLKRKLTPDEERRELLSKDNGKRNWQENQKSAETAYQKAVSLSPGHAKTHRGLAQLYETSGRKPEALAAYRKYLELHPQALDRQRVLGRIEALQRGGAQ